MTLPADDEPKTRQNMCLKSPANASQEDNRPVEELMGEKRVAVNYIREQICEIQRQFD
jgi:hypothetical protein